jgi:endonuclease YncB( thermonuclease family)
MILSALSTAILLTRLVAIIRGRLVWSWTPLGCLTSLFLLAPLLVPPPVQGQAPPVLTGIVFKVVDGDTIHVRIGNRIEKVRYIGMNAPKLHHPTKSVEPLAHEAMKANRKLVEGQMVRLELDVQERDPRRSGTRLGTRPPTSGGARRHEDDLFHQPTRTH